MICPYCGANDDKVIDSRATEAGAVIRRRRQCLNCERRFTTYERIEQASRLTVVKKDGSRVPFDPENIARGVRGACGKRPVPEEDKRRLVEEVEEELHAEFEREVLSTVIGERVLAKLRNLDQIAYIRFATEHLQMGGLDELQKELEDLMSRPVEARDQQPLFTKKS
ncbi:MAG: transcriptional regulator NrdR [Phycisphaerae bacterium]|nr:transcriptional regulator NrdR [Phycisphaerae bacterium]